MASATQPSCLNTTCERVALAVWERCAAALPGPPTLTSLKIVARESDVAFVEYEQQVRSLQAACLAPA